MADLFEQVYHHIEGRETEIQNWQTLDGIKTVEFHSFGPDRWIENVYERSRMTGIECLALILFEVDVSFSDPEPARRIVEGWAAELRKAVSAGEIQARDPVTLLALETLPDGWEWLLTMADGDKFIAARGMEWRFCEVALHLFNEFEQAIENRRFPPWTRTTPATDTAPAQTPAPKAASDGPAKPHSNKSEKTLIFEAKVLELLGKFWNDRTPNTEPTKGDLCKLVYDEILRTPVRGARKTTRGMVNDVAKLWKMPIVLPALVPDSKFNDKRHPFKGDK